MCTIFDIVIYFKFDYKLWSYKQILYAGKCENKTNNFTNPSLVLKIKIYHYIKYSIFTA
jgi:hypothetical protein